MLETPWILGYSSSLARAVKIHKVRTISRKGSWLSRTIRSSNGSSRENPQRLHARPRLSIEMGMIQSELHSDMQGARYELRDRCASIDRNDMNGPKVEDAALVKFG